MREPLDTDLHMPKVLGREEAAERLLVLLPAELVDRVWDELIAPLYDARALRQHWSRGRCIRCHVDHPDSWAQTRPGALWRGHRMYCPLYVGPLEHILQGGNQSFAGWRLRCSCGQSWLQYDGDGNQKTCPDAAVDWRGPRPTDRETP